MVKNEVGGPFVYETTMSRMLAWHRTTGQASDSRMQAVEWLCPSTWLHSTRESTRHRPLLSTDYQLACSHLRFLKQWTQTFTLPVINHGSSCHGFQSWQ